MSLLARPMHLGFISMRQLKQSRQELDPLAVQYCFAEPEPTVVMLAAS